MITKHLAVAAFVVDEDVAAVVAAAGMAAVLFVENLNAAVIDNIHESYYCLYFYYYY